ncbi:MAG: hypothetical protein A2744_04665 [Candidatus Buchananbacteria bacterium RIFCSPHIGHO2_01_FULL_44_11]|uniref:Transcriptional regulator n=1 Tax=Candidatus Buchananbacteria bacterium RIFCSPHIGHO2_01_FULL_44_11 TaxID=1797535 RepID=A0A1G1Y353_9BACT|nr:MAG: hypothetical protein A2744_04665 [Candidatus Buchananbacteria bacterium RIFCSPHIGHO2_01_FULL_44_11]
MDHGHIQPEYKKRLIHRLKILAGQLRGLEKAVEDQDYCLDILAQSSAVQESLKSFDALMLENHLHTHVANSFRGKEIQKAVEELLRIYKLNRR